MREIMPDGEHKSLEASSWATIWVLGELASATTWDNVTRHLAAVKDPSNAKVFQGTANGDPAVYVVFRQ